MELQTIPTPTFNTVTAYGNEYIEINRQKYTHSVIVMPEGKIMTWPVKHYDELDAHHFAMLTAYQPELVIFGSGQRHLFPHPSFIKPLTVLGIGVETMATQAACRTYNILVAEDRKILAALLLETK